MSCWGQSNRGCRSFASETSCAIRLLLEKAKQEAEFYLGKEKSAVTAKMIARIKQDPRFGLAAIG